jgi:ABC-type thiamin/hydroxymethylpyrimidine transport system permease subunit
MFKTRELALIIILSALGGAMSVPLGYAGNLLNAVPILPFGSPQILSGIHVLWLLLARLLTRKTGAATFAGAVKGLAELTLFSFHGVQILPISIVEGIVVDLVLSVPVRASLVSVAVAGGVSASSNVLVLWLLLLQGLSPLVIVFMWLLSLVSGVIIGCVGEYVSRRVALLIGEVSPSIVHSSF